jgi:hypothetical protein
MKAGIEKQAGEQQESPGVQPQSFIAPAAVREEVIDRQSTIG